MATRPTIVTITNTSADVLNAIRNDASTDYRDYVPIATQDAEVIRTIGATIMDFPALRNEFLNALVNRIARVLITSKMYENPWAFFKQGRFDYGETIEEIFVDLCAVHNYDPATAEKKVFAREIPDVRAAFHVLNYRKFYKNTIQYSDLRKAFMSVDGVTNLINGIMTSMYKSASYDEWLVMKFMLQYRMAIGVMATKTMSATANDKELATAVKAVSNQMTFLSNDYNLAGVYNATEKDKQYLIMDADTDASMDVNVLASAFNMDKAQFLGHRVLVDNFGTIDVARLDKVFDNDETGTDLQLDPNYVRMKTAMGIDENGVVATLAKVKGVLLDEEFFKVFDNDDSTDTLINPEGRYTNYWYHVDKTFSVSPFANAVMFKLGE